VKKVFHFVHSVNTKNGGVAEAVIRLNEEFNNHNIPSDITDKPCFIKDKNTHIIAHGLWQWPSHQGV
jgi:hypothetical protein